MRIEDFIALYDYVLSFGLDKFLINYLPSDEVMYKQYCINYAIEFCRGYRI